MLLTITDFSTGEGVYTAEQLTRLVPRLGYKHLVSWDRGLHGYPRLREELEFALAPVRLHLGCRFTWRGQDFGALPFTNEGYGALNRLLTGQAHKEGEGEPPRDCVLLAERFEGLELLAREGFEATLLGHPRRQQEAAEALRRGLSGLRAIALLWRQQRAFGQARRRPPGAAVAEGQPLRLAHPALSRPRAPLPVREGLRQRRTALPRLAGTPP